MVDVLTNSEVVLAVVVVVQSLVPERSGGQMAKDLTLDNIQEKRPHIIHL